MEKLFHLSHLRQVFPASSPAAFEVQPLADPLAPYDQHYEPAQTTTLSQMIQKILYFRVELEAIWSAAE